MNFNPGTGGTLKSVTAEDAVIELLVLIKNAEEAKQAADPEFETKINLSLDMSEKRISFDGFFTTTVTNGTDGRPVINATEYILGV